ncbi:tRNA guanosine(34) transglycosylase Tgt [Chloroflexota bacterium]
MNENGYKIIKTDADARAGELRTAHGTVLTPVFMPVGSQATVKTLTSEEISGMGWRMVLANAYHLYLRPGVDIIEEIGGLHRFMGWGGAILTDSGGYQIFSLAPLCRIDDEGVVFRSHIDGSKHSLTPETAVQMQERIGADIIMALDECRSHDSDYDGVKAAMRRTQHWAERCLKAHKREEQSLYAIVQGGMFPELRRQSAADLSSLGFDGYAIGGLSIGEPKTVTLNMLEETVPYLPADRIRYLMGVGSPEDIVEGVARGIDMFDSALPTRVARNGALFTLQGRRNIGNAAFKKMDRPFDPDCGCYTCRNFSAAYLHHLFRAGELLGLRLATLHNLTFVQNLLKQIRVSILDGSFTSFREDFLAEYRTTDEKTRVSQKQKWLNARKTA